MLCLSARKAQRMQVTLQQGQFAIDLQGDDPGQRPVHQFKLLVPAARLLYCGLEGELALIDLVDQRSQQRALAAGRRSQPGRRWVALVEQPARAL